MASSGFFWSNSHYTSSKLSVWGFAANLELRLWYFIENAAMWWIDNIFVDNGSFLAWSVLELLKPDWLRRKRKKETGKIIVHSKTVVLNIYLLAAIGLYPRYHAQKCFVPTRSCELPYWHSWSTRMYITDKVGAHSTWKWMSQKFTVDVLVSHHYLIINDRSECFKIS